jgi:putative MATE family efflux protein
MQLALTELPLQRAIYRLAWPAMASMVLASGFSLVDAFWVGRLGTEALGGVSAASFLIWCIHSLAQIAGMGVNAVVARHVGANDARSAGIVGGHGILLALSFGLLLIPLALPGQAHLFHALRLEAGVHQAAVAYFTPTIYGIWTITAWYAVEGVYRGSGDTRTPMWILAATLVINGVLDPLLIFGLGPFPRLGVAGAAWATVFSHLLGVFVGLGCLRRRAIAPRVPRWRELDPMLIRRIVSIGAPVAFGEFLLCLIYLPLTRIIAGFGSSAVAAIGIGHRIEGIAYLTAVGFSAAATTLVGQHLGRGEAERADRSAWLAASYAAVILVALSVVYYLAAEPILGLFSDDPFVLRHGVGYLRAIAVFQPLFALEIVLAGASTGAGKSLPPMIIGVPLTAARVPVAYLLAERFGWGAAGVWWAISTSTALKGILMGLWFRLGSWKTAGA